MQNMEFKESSTLQYALEKYANAVKVLTTGSGDVRSRLRDAYEFIAVISPNYVPNDDGLRTDIKWIRDEMDRRFADCSGVDWSMMMQRFQNRTGVKIAERIHTVLYKLRQQQAKLDKKNIVLQHFGKPGLN